MRRCSIAVSLALVLAACGGDDQNGRLADAPPAVDARIPDVSTGPPSPVVTLTITSNGMPVSGVTVYFVNPDDSPVATVQTDATGTASATIAAGGSVTAVNPFPRRAPAAVSGADDLRTFAGVALGDHLFLTGSLPAVQFTLHAPAVPGAAEYLVLTGCGSAVIPANTGSGGSGPDPTGSVTLSGCGGTADVLVVAHNSDSNPISALYHAGVTITDGGTVDLTADSYQAVADLSLGYTNLAPGTGALSATYALGTAHGVFEPLFTAGAEVVDGMASVTQQAPSFTGAIAAVDTSITLNAQHHVVDWGPYTASYQIDLASQLLPDIVDTPGFDPTTGRISWTEAATGARPDLTSAAILVSRGERTWHWEIAAPYAPGELRFPVLPTEVFAWTPMVDDAITVEHVMNARLPGGYAAVRPHMLDIEDRLDVPRQVLPDQHHVALVSGAAGRAVAVQFLQPPILALGRNR